MRGITSMMLKSIYIRFIQLLVLILFITLIFAQKPVFFVVIYAISTVLLIFSTILTKQFMKTKIILILIYILILVLQQVYINGFVFNEKGIWIAFIIEKIVAIIIIFVPFFVRYLHYLYTLENQFSSQEQSSVNFAMIKLFNNKHNSLKQNLNQGKVALSKENLNEILEDIPRHSYVRYLNKNTLNDNYFEECIKSLSDPYIYIVISSTGSSASEVISLFTHKIYNHVSLSFDKDLKTTISYNGGEKLTQPGLNSEQIISFNKKSDASIMVYKLATTIKQKKKMIDTIKEINQQGSAYNLVGLITKISIRPNIMFCSQFVYTKVKPTDFVEKDYYRKLEYCYEIKFNELDDTITS
ncbi:hypothetical protein [Staphylococcus xylosus]